MARRTRKTPLEKYQEELAQVQASMEQYENCLETMREKERELEGLILMEKFKEINALLEDQNLSLDDLRELICGNESTAEQIA